MLDAASTIGRDRLEGDVESVVETPVFRAFRSRARVLLAAGVEPADTVGAWDDLFVGNITGELFSNVAWDWRTNEAASHRMGAAFHLLKVRDGTNLKMVLAADNEMPMDGRSNFDALTAIGGIASDKREAVQKTPSRDSAAFGPMAAGPENQPSRLGATHSVAGQPDGRGHEAGRRSHALDAQPVGDQARASFPVEDSIPQRALVATVPRAFLAMARRAVLHTSPARFDLLYMLLWRLVHEPAMRHDPLDADALRVRQLARAVQRDAYKMRAFVRFRPVDDRASGPEEAARRAVPLRESHALLHIAWFEPEHDVLEAVAPWFARRFAGMRWAILTPRRSVRFSPTTGQLQFELGAQRHEAPQADAGEALWLIYYRHIFNPARLNLGHMTQHMPRKYWRNLPEAATIDELALQAGVRTATMLAGSPTERVAVRALPKRPQNTGGPLLRAAADHQCFDVAATGHGLLVSAARTSGRDANVIIARQPNQCSANGNSLGSMTLPNDATTEAPRITPHTCEPMRDSLPNAVTDSVAARRRQLLADIDVATQGCNACPLGAKATQAVNGQGPIGASLMFVGEQPGDREDLAGEPFVGPAGRLLNQALSEAGIDRAVVFITNTVRHFKFEMRGKRRIHKTPVQHEIAACQRWLDQEIAAVAPGALVALGATAARALLGRGATIRLTRGRWLDGVHQLPVLVTWHPSSLLRMDGPQQLSVWPLWIADLKLAARPPFV